jgi:micrococcal nuclease
MFAGWCPEAEVGGSTVRRILKFTAIGCGGLLGLVIFLGVVGAIIGGGTDTSSPPERAEKRKGIEQAEKEQAKQPKQEIEKEEPSAGEAPPTPADQGGDEPTATAKITRVVDGDTIEISRMISGTDEVRLIGVDTPETKDPDEGVEPYGPEASTFATDELTGRRVGLEFDVERVDQYDRLLAYVYAGGEMFNEDLVEEGYAQTYPYPPNTKYADRFEEAQEGARAGGLGIWGLSLDQQCQLANHGNGIGEGSAGCEVVTDPSATATATATSTATAGGAAGGAVPPISEENCPPNAPIKGNESSSGELIYHMPNDAYYDATHPEECFATPQDAEAAGYRAAEV